MAETWTQRQINALTGADRERYDMFIASGFRPADAYNMTVSTRADTAANVQALQSGQPIDLGNAPMQPAQAQGPAAVQGPTVTGAAPAGRGVPGVTPGVAGPFVPAAPAATTPATPPTAPLDPNAQYLKELEEKDIQDTIEYIRQVSLTYGIETLSDEMIKLVRQGYRGEALSFMLRSTQAYKTRFIGNEERTKAGLPPLSPSDYLQAEQQYADILQRYGLTGLANRGTYAKLIGGQVSANEAEDRIVNVYDRIKNADAALKKEMETLGQFGLTRADWAESLLTGKEGAASLKRKIAQAEISTEFTGRGIQSALGIQELERLGVTRQQAQAGAEYAKTGTQRLQDLAAIYGAQPTDIQAELEQEAFKGMASQRRRQLTGQERAAFAGASGTGTPSLGRPTIGAI